MTNIIIAGQTGRMAQMLLKEAAARPQYQTLGLGRGDVYAFQPNDVFIDFTHASALDRNIERLQGTCTAYLVGTTGLEHFQMEQLKLEGNKRPVLYAPNTSTIVTLMRKVLEIMSPYLKSYECQIEEIHHVHKKDAPSGTALALKESLGPYGAGIQIESLRQGEEIGYHKVTFSNAYETFTLAHQAHNRQLFAQGAIDAALWLLKQPPGFYAMGDMVQTQQ